MQAEQLLLHVDETYGQLVRDYADVPAPRRCSAIRQDLGKLSTEQLLEAETIGQTLGISAADSDEHIRPRGYRALSSIPMLPTSVVGRIVDRFGSLTDILRASVDDLDDVDGVGSRRAAAITGGLARMRAHLAV
jgi:diadenylate cyclase